MATFTDEQKRITQSGLQAVLRDMQQGRVPPTPRLDPAREAFLDKQTILEMPAMPRTDKLPAQRQKTPFETWLDQHIFAFWEREHTFPHSIHISSIRKLEHIVEQLEREDAPIRWHEYTFRHTNGWISIQLETRIMGYSEVTCE